MRSSPLTVLSFFVAVLMLLPLERAGAQRLELTLKETHCGFLPVFPDRQVLAETITVSPDNRKVACVVQLSESPQKKAFEVFIFTKGGRQSSAEYEAVIPNSLVFSPDSENFAFIGIRSSKFFLVVNGKERGVYEAVLPPAFTPDGKKIVYAARLGQKSFVVVESVSDSQGEFYGAGGKGREYDAVGMPVIDRSGKRIAYAAKRGEKWFVVADGKEGTEYDEIPADSLVFSLDGSRLAYVARRGEDWLVVADGKESQPHEGVKKGSGVFSPDGKRIAYVVRKGEKQVPIVDGSEWMEFDKVIAVNFSPNGQRVFCVGQQGEKVTLVLDGTEVEDNIVVPPVFSPDGQRMAYGVSSEGKQFVVLDGVKGKSYDEILPSLAFSPDGKRFIYAARKGKKFVAVVDGVESKEYDGLWYPSIFTPSKYNGRPWFTPFSLDSKRVAYFAQRDGKWFVVVDGVELKRRYDSVGNLLFTPNGEQVVCVAKRGNKTIVAVNESELEFDGILRGSDIFFDSPSSFHIFSLKPSKGVIGLLLTEVEIKAK
ncbi:MAG: hypothetical protein N3B10_06260 [Armatimonadetes bacterium]|nr:hypothetical protein [Armatimonadota bacterium]